ncbi:hypothetical protein PCAR4_350155 [Paraburkholderia caribensis]|nr:hypothetical protein PCAR4_350155 [Paraburkholderia caribensis]
MMTVAFERLLQRRQVFCIIVDQKKVCRDFGLHVIYPGLAVMDDVVRTLWLLRQRSRSRCALPCAARTRLQCSGRIELERLGARMQTASGERICTVRC